MNFVYFCVYLIVRSYRRALNRFIFPLRFLSRARHQEEEKDNY
nr:MAG TPA: hypothetical protein [Caudoviricetes sp.]